MTKAEVWVVKRDDGKYAEFLDDEWDFTDKIQFAEFYPSKGLAEIDWGGHGYKIVKVEISETVSKNMQKSSRKCREICRNKQDCIEKIAEIYKMYPSGGALHIVLDDENVEDNFIIWCIEDAIKKNFHQYYDKDSNHTLDEDQKIFLQAARMLLALESEKERLEVIHVTQEKLSHE